MSLSTKHQADANKNPCLRYQAKTEARYQANGDRNNWPLYQAKTEGDDKPLLQLNNKMTKATAGRVARHKDKVQDRRLTEEHLPGKARPGDNATCQAAPTKNLDEEVRERQMVDTGGDIQVKRVLIANQPPALSLEVLKEVVEQDKVYQRPKEVVKAGRKPKNRETLGPTKTFNSICLYLPEQLQKDVWSRDCVTPRTTRRSS